MARIGSSFFLVPLPKIDRPGSSLSFARAWKSLADPIIPIKAEKKVTAHSPASMIGEDKFVSERTLLLASRESRLVVAAMDRTTTKYTMNVVNMAQSVPFGIALLGFLRSPDMDAPAKMPDVALMKMSAVCQ